MPAADNWISNPYAGQSNPYAAPDRDVTLFQPTFGRFGNQFFKPGGNSFGQSLIGANQQQKNAFGLPGSTATGAMQLQQNDAVWNAFISSQSGLPAEALRWLSQNRSYIESLADQAIQQMGGQVSRAEVLGGLDTARNWQSADAFSAFRPTSWLDVANIRRTGG